MRTCTLCHAKSPDTAIKCTQCGSELSVHSSTAVALKDLRDNPRVSKIRLIVAEDACPACREIEREYTKDNAPDLPTPGCSHPLGCRCFYEPRLVEIFP